VCTVWAGLLFACACFFLTLWKEVLRKHWVWIWSVFKEQTSSYPFVPAEYCSTCSYIHAYHLVFNLQIKWFPFLKNQLLKTTGHWNDAVKKTIALGSSYFLWSLSYLDTWQPGRILLKSSHSHASMWSVNQFIFL